MYKIFERKKIIFLYISPDCNFEYSVRGGGAQLTHPVLTVQSPVYKSSQKSQTVHSANVLPRDFGNLHQPFNLLTRSSSSTAISK